jgi:hypothetical protein
MGFAKLAGGAGLATGLCCYRGKILISNNPYRFIKPEKYHLKIDMLNAGYGIRTRELLRDRILSPAQFVAFFVCMPVIESLS